MVYNRHFYYIDLGKYGVDVNYFNFVRHPVERFISNFYYERSPNRWLGRHDRPKDSWFRKTLDQCVADEEDRECQIGVGQELQMRYFCDCYTSSMTEEEMMMEALRTVDQDFSVVGVLEMFNDSLAVLEQFLPSFFEGAREAFPRVEEKFFNHNPHRKVLNKTREILSQRLKYDIEFYQFVKQRLSLQLQKINMRTNK